ncbi:MAG: hypothetical protein IKN04_12485 [Clostridia bacterium]|nr:hypothetical protein [Clostridia bacterium]
MKKNLAFLIILLLLTAVAFTALADGTWYCPQCGRRNSENFCPADGTRRPASASTSSNNGSFTIITTSHVNIRSGPASYYSLVGEAEGNTVFTAYGRTASHEGGQDWYEIQYYGQRAYVSVIYAVVSSQSGSSATSQQSGGSYTITDNRKNGNYSNYSRIRCALNSKLATRTGPGTNYDEPGTFLSAGSYVTVLSKAYDKVNEIWWVQVEFSENGVTYWAYTGVKRLNGLNLANVPEEKVIGHCTTTNSTKGYECPLDSMRSAAQRSSIPAGVCCAIYGYVFADSGDYILIEFFDRSMNCYCRAWVKDWSVENYTMDYGF